MQSELFVKIVREFADNILTKARFRGSPLFMNYMDGDRASHGFHLLTGTVRRFTLSDLAGQQDLIRMLVGLTHLTSDDKYRLAARDAVALIFRELADSSGLLIWGGHTAVALPMHKVAFEKRRA